MQFERWRTIGLMEVVVISENWSVRDPARSVGVSSPAIGLKARWIREALPGSMIVVVDNLG